MDSSPTEREILLIEKLGLAKHIIDVYETLFIALVVRMGGAVHITNEELDYSEKTYDLHKEFTTSDLTRNVKMSVRLK